jgi:hypothetical protein
VRSCRMSCWRRCWSSCRWLWVTLRARWVTLRARWVTLRARWVTVRARWVTLRARWVTLRARWVTLRARWVTKALKGVFVDINGATNCARWSTRFTVAPPPWLPASQDFYPAIQLSSFPNICNSSAFLSVEKPLIPRALAAALRSLTFMPL